MVAPLTLGHCLLLYAPAWPADEQQAALLEAICTPLVPSRSHETAQASLQ